MLKLSTFLFAFLPCVLFSLSSQALAEVAGDTGVKGERVFYASHSLMWYVPDQLTELASAQGIDDHQLVGLQKIGASRTLQHWQLPDDENLAKEALRQGDVDVFVMSPIQFPDEGIENFIKLGLKHNPEMRFLVQLSWGGGDIDNQDFPNGAWEVPDRDKTPEQLSLMNARNIRAGEIQIDSLNEKYGDGQDIVFLIPASQAASELRSRIYRKEMPGLEDQDELFVDPAHPSAPLEALNTYLHFAVLYQQSPLGLPATQKLEQVNRPQWDESLTRTLQEIAWQTAANYSRSGLPNVDAEEISAAFDFPQPVEYPELEFVYTANIKVGEALDFGQVDDGKRLVIPIVGGTFHGPDIQGEVVPGGVDWNLSRSDGATEADATYFLRTEDGVLIRVSNLGVGAPPTGLRFTTPRFIAPRGQYDWLNQSTFVGTLDVDWKREFSIRLRVFRVRSQESPQPYRSARGMYFSTVLPLFSKHVIARLKS